MLRQSFGGTKKEDLRERVVQCAVFLHNIARKEVKKPLVSSGSFAHFSSCWEKWAAGGRPRAGARNTPAAGARNTPAAGDKKEKTRQPLTSDAKRAILFPLQAMMGVAARSRGRKCPPDAPLPA